MIEIKRLPLGPIQTNCYILTCQDTRRTAVIDPSADGRNIAAALDEGNHDLSHILLTHAHFDHVGGLAQLKEEYPQIPVYIHPDAVEMLSQSGMQAAFFGMQVPAPPEPEEMLAEGDVIYIGNLKIDVLYTPGHAPGHVSFHLAEYKALFSGDVLFQGSIGRTDLPGGDHELLLKTIQEKLMALPDETHVLSGHGEITTIGAERNSNPFLLGWG